MDEMWSYYHNKSNQLWLWWAVEHETNTPLAYTFGTISIWMNCLLCSSPFQLERFMLTIITHIKSGFLPIYWLQGKRIHNKLRVIIWPWEHVSKGWPVKPFAFLKIRTFILLWLVLLLIPSSLVEILTPQLYCDITENRKKLTLFLVPRRRFERPTLRLGVGFTRCLSVAVNRVNPWYYWFLPMFHYLICKAFPAHSRCFSWSQLAGY